PPAFGEKIVSFLLIDENAEEILGDLAELFNVRGQQGNLIRARLWYFRQIIHSAPSLLQIKLSKLLERSHIVMSANLKSHNKTVLWVSLIAVIPALALVIPGILQSGFGYLGANDARDALFTAVPAIEILLNPVILMGGLLLAFVLNALPAMKFHFERKPDGLATTITFRPVLLHWIIVGASVLMVAIILVYAFFENFGPLIH
ncbi:MAG: hypothetical protein R3351_09195, partial [Nitrospirales bacterium]|nr:hypothetical protein [Nitrospirales bacterium]